MILTGSMDGVVRVSMFALCNEVSLLFLQYSSIFFQMWGIEFYDEAAKNRRSVKLSPKTNDSVSRAKQEKKSDVANDEYGNAGTQTPASSSLPSPGSLPITGDKSSVDMSPQSNPSVVSSEQAEPRSVKTNEKTSEEKAGHHVTFSAAGDSETGKRHVMPNLRDESVDDGYVIICHKDKCEKEELTKPGIVSFTFLNVSHHFIISYVCRMNLLQSNQVKRTPVDYINESII